MEIVILGGNQPFQRLPTHPDPVTINHDLGVSLSGGGCDEALAIGNWP
jgi:hypothetical protein